MLKKDFFVQVRSIFFCRISKFEISLDITSTGMANFDVTGQTLFSNIDTNAYNVHMYGDNSPIEIAFPLIGYLTRAN